MNKVKKKIYTNISLLAVATLSLLYANIIYLTKNIENSSMEIVEKKKSVERLTIQNSQMQNNIDEALQYIVDYSSISDFVAEMKSTAIKNNIELDMKVADKEKTEITDGLSFVDYNIKVAGKFNEMVQYLIYLENSKYYVNIEKIKISSSYIGNTDTDDKITFDLALKVYVWD
jgi:hypothetical protein